MRCYEIERWGKEAFELLPGWAQSAPSAHTAVVIGFREEDALALALSKRVELLQGENLLVCYFGSNPKKGYQSFFEQFLKGVVQSDEKLNCFFSVYIPRNENVDGFEMQELVIDTLFHHLAWYYISPSKLYEWSKERFDLCKTIAASLMFAYQPLGAPQ